MAAFNKISSTYKPVAEYYAGKSLFITGGTGFLGKVLIEKLLYSCKDIDKIYILVRNKNNIEVNKRMNQMLNNPLFTRLKQNKADCLTKLIPIVGDITERNLGMTPADERLLIEKVSVVFHSAATVQFNDPLPEAVRVNVEGTKNIIDFCHKLKNIDMLVHISTIYANCNRKIIEEIVYPPPVDFTELNTYIQTVSCDEKTTTNILVGPIKNDPYPGWLDNWFGGTSLFWYTSIGLLRILPGSADGVVDIIPVDYVCNLMIVAAVKCQRSKLLHVYNSCTSECNPVTMNELTKLVLQEKNNNYFTYPKVHFTTSKNMMMLLSFVLETIPAYVGDIWLWITGRKMRLVKLHSIMNNHREKLEYFTSNYWQARCNNTKSLIVSLSDVDRKTFCCDSTDINWKEYIQTYLVGIRKYLLRSND
ncbi:putative fatty acyl-CoA reductase CG5065 isoform X2 [Galleria mellonella]|uniref:Fatty acyl-CoA reductase n=1 Tax=Galleria mellonella TaxID=7137 RepID=A0ABM3MBH1_GALME|nr:putative fatty acyl-CoA reductase CG5065 isoform X2 [Galleria mellonella]